MIPQVPCIPTDLHTDPAGSQQTLPASGMSSMTAEGSASAFTAAASEPLTPVTRAALTADLDQYLDVEMQMASQASAAGVAVSSACVAMSSPPPVQMAAIASQNVASSLCAAAGSELERTDSLDKVLDEYIAGLLMSSGEYAAPMDVGTACCSYQYFCMQHTCTAHVLSSRGVEVLDNSR